MFAGFRKNRTLLTAWLAALGLGVVIFYTYCDSACTYLRGDVLGIDLKYAGIAFMGGILTLALLEQAKAVRLLLAAAIGAEIFLVSFQFQENVFCPYCLAFAAVIFSAFLVNHEAHRAQGILKNMLYRFGAVSAGGRPVPLAVPMILGFVFMILAFSGSATPAYGLERPALPSFGKGPPEVIIFTDYFCTPCRELEPYLDPALEDLLSEGRVKVTFVDVPMHRLTQLYARYFLYACNSAGGFRDALAARRALFTLAAGGSAPDEKALAAAMRERGIAFQPYDISAAYDEFNKVLKKYNVRSTPQCVIRFSDTDVRNYEGTGEMRRGIETLQSVRKNRKS